MLKIVLKQYKKNLKIFFNQNYLKDLPINRKLNKNYSKRYFFVYLKRYTGVDSDFTEILELFSFFGNKSSEVINSVIVVSIADNGGDVEILLSIPKPVLESSVSKNFLLKN